MADQGKIPMMYGIHHHRCLPDEFSGEEITEKLISLWKILDREPYVHTYVHISSPKQR